MTQRKSRKKNIEPISFVQSSCCFCCCCWFHVIFCTQRASALLPPLQCGVSELKMIALGIVYPFWMSSSSPSSTSPFEYRFGWLCGGVSCCLFFLPFFCVSTMIFSFSVVKLLPETKSNSLLFFACPIVVAPLECNFAQGINNLPSLLFFSLLSLPCFVCYCCEHRADWIRQPS